MKDLRKEKMKRTKEDKRHMMETRKKLRKTESWKKKKETRQIEEERWKMKSKYFSFLKTRFNFFSCFCHRNTSDFRPIKPWAPWGQWVPCRAFVLMLHTRAHTYQSFCQGSAYYVLFHFVLINSVMGKRKTAELSKFHDLTFFCNDHLDSKPLL